MLRENYDLPTLISAVITFMVVVLAIRFMLYYANRKGSQIQKPDWVDDDRFNLKKKKKK
ncbi:hypothetical protein [Helicobacter sp. MIT 11-5569]|uniref:hypothetical protein n=1 Tax=Helicobacter sp. MIT 11-5569 TaxID=1548151 RepID=UPI000A87A9E7|nr:hypothetical protein [Helicobacter sp. MIT 11-5569]